MIRLLIAAVIVVANISRLAALDQPLGAPSSNADMNAREVTSLLFKTKSGVRPNLSGRSLAFLDLAGLNFKSANLTRVDFFGADLTGANLSGADLSLARLDRSTLIHADFARANLSGATILRPTIYADLSQSKDDAPRFSDANLTGVRFIAELSGSDFRGADLTRADFFPLATTVHRDVLKYCDFSGARLTSANMRYAVLWLAKFNGADLRGANFSDADLSGADLAGANIAGADFSGANLDNANFVGAIGISEAKGLDHAINFGSAHR